METKEQLKFTLTPEALDEGPPEEKAGFGMVTIEVNGHVLTEGISRRENNAFYKGPHVSGSHLVEWLLWNWWRLLWEPRPAGLDNDDDVQFEWVFAHNLCSIGEGYLWPDIEMSSDGVFMRVVSSPTRDPDEIVFRYLPPPRDEIITVEAFKDALDEFAGVVLERLDEANIRDTNLHSIWRELEREREDEAATAFRRMEAILGHDPGEGDDNQIRECLEDIATLGKDAVDELAAHVGQRKERPARASELKDSARQAGFDMRAGDAVQLDAEENIPAWGTCRAWRIGVSMAQAVRKDGGFNDQPIKNADLADLAGTSKKAVKNIDRTTDSISFALDGENGRSRIAMRSGWETGRRFDLARLLGDKLRINHIDEALHPATRSKTYRQKFQRAFATELLAPIEALDDFLGDDTSEEKQNDAGRHFNVSPQTIQTQLLNNDRISREEALDIT